MEWLVGRLRWCSEVDRMKRSWKMFVDFGNWSVIAEKLLLFMFCNCRFR